MIRPTPLTALSGLALFLAALYLLYLVTANALLASDWARNQLEHPPHLTLDWERAWTVYPGHLRVTGLRLAGTTAGHRYALEAEKATLGVSLASLPGRDVHIRHLAAEGIRHVGLDAYRLPGNGNLRLAGIRIRAGELAVERLQLTLTDGAIIQGDTPLVESVALNADLELAPLVLAEQAGRGAARFVSGRVALAGDSDAYDVFNPYLAALGWLEIGGHGEVAGDIVIARGDVQPDSRLRLDSPRLSVRLDERHWLEGGRRYRIQGAGTVEASVEEDARLAVTLAGIEMFDADATASAPRPLLGGDGFALELTTAELSLHAPPKELQRAELGWQNTEVDDIAAFARYLPEQVPLALEGGSARLRGGLTYDAERLSGRFDLNGEAIRVRLGEQPLSGRLALHLPIAELDPTRGAADISGTRLELEVAAPGEGRPLSTALELPIARFRSPLAWRELDDGFRFDGEMPWEAELALRGRIANLGVLDPFLTDLLGGGGLALEGGGRLDGALHIRDGQPREGSHLEVRSEALGARFFGLHARGDGRAHLVLRPGEPYPQASVALTFDGGNLTRLADRRRLFEAEQLSLIAETEIGPQATAPRTLQMAWQGARLPDVSVLNAYLPVAAPLELHSGGAESEGHLSLEEGQGQGRISLAGDAIHGRLLEEAFQGELDVALALEELSPARRLIDLSGSRLELTASTNRGETLRTLLVLRQASLAGGFDWPGSEAPPQPLSGTLRLDGRLDRLGFLNAFLPDAHGLAIQGGGRLSAELRLANGSPAPGSQLRVYSDRLTTRFLHYEAYGDGSLALETTDPGAQLRLSLPRFGLRRQESPGALIEGRLLEINSRAPHLDRDDGRRALSTRIDMPHLVVPDLAALNAYLPEDAGIEFLSGEARLATHLRLEGLGAEGELELHAPDARLAFDQQVLSGELTLATRLADGDLETLDFDVSGSQLSLNNVRLENAAGSLARGWWARLAVAEGHMRWEAPLKLDARLELAMRDSGLLVNLFVDAARERRWLRDRLTLGDVRGEARAMFEDDTIRLENLAVRSGERLELLANIALRDAHLAGRAFARYGPLRLGIELDGDRRRWQLRNAREWYTSGRPASELTLPARQHWYERLDAQPE